MAPLIERSRSLMSDGLHGDAISETTPTRSYPNSFGCQRQTKANERMPRGGLVKRSRVAAEAAATPDRRDSALGRVHIVLDSFARSASRSREPATRRSRTSSSAPALNFAGGRSSRSTSSAPTSTRLAFLETYFLTSRVFAHPSPLCLSATTTSASSPSLGPLEEGVLRATSPRASTAGRSSHPPPSSARRAACRADGCGTTRSSRMDQRLAAAGRGEPDASSPTRSAGSTSRLTGAGDRPAPSTTSISGTDSAGSSRRQEDQASKNPTTQGITPGSGLHGLTCVPRHWTLWGISQLREVTSRVRPGPTATARHVAVP